MPPSWRLATGCLEKLQQLSHRDPPEVALRRPFEEQPDLPLVPLDPVALPPGLSEVVQLLFDPGIVPRLENDDLVLPGANLLDFLLDPLGEVRRYPFAPLPGLLIELPDLFPDSPLAFRLRRGSLLSCAGYGACACKENQDTNETDAKRTCALRWVLRRPGRRTIRPGARSRVGGKPGGSCGGTEAYHPSGGPKRIISPILGSLTSVGQRGDTGAPAASGAESLSRAIPRRGGHGQVH